MLTPHALATPLRPLAALRLASGLVLALFVSVHLSNLALGVISADAQEATRKVLSPIWRSVPGTLVLYTALIVHALLGLYALWRRRTLRMPPWELAQLVLGLSVPLLLMPHVFGTRGAAIVLDATTTYPTVIRNIWSSPVSLVRQPVLVLFVWGHLLIGLHYWLRLRAGYRRALPVLYPIAMIVPVVALLGFWGAGIELRKNDLAGATVTSSATYADAYDAIDDYGGRSSRADPAARERLETSEDAAVSIYAAVLILVVLARMLRRVLSVRRGVYRIHHSNGRVIAAPIGQSLLEALRHEGIAHASVCGGRGRCTTCRVRVGHGLATLPAAEALEISALHRIRAEADVRLACQLRPRRDLQITPLLPPHVAPADIDGTAIPGREHSVAVMFVDLRDSSKLAEQRLPYDVFFILNRFLAEVTEALQETGGFYSTFNGDGLMALYGTRTALRDGCRDAMRGAVAIQRRLATLNAAFASDLGEPLRAGISIHAGEAIVGSMGPPDRPVLSALGDTVNVAARLESETKRHHCVLVVSAACAAAAGIDLHAFPEHTAGVRGRLQPVTYYAIEDPASLAGLLESERAPSSRAEMDGPSRGYARAGTAAPDPAIAREPPGPEQRRR